MQNFIKSEMHKDMVIERRHDDKRMSISVCTQFNKYCSRSS